MDRNEDETKANPPPDTFIALIGDDDCDRHRDDDGRGHDRAPVSHAYPRPLVRQRSMATLFTPYTDKEARLRRRFRQTIEFPISSMILMNSQALARVRTRMPALQGLHWPHIRFMKHHPQWLWSDKHHEQQQLEPTPKTGWALMTPANRLLVVSCCLSWCGFYICRSHIPVLLPVISQETGLSLSLFSSVFSAGLITTAVGKVLNGMLADRYGGQIMFVTYLALAIVTTLLMTLSPTVTSAGTFAVLAFWTTVWCLNRWFHSGAWGSMILMLSVQLPQRAYGRSLSIVSLGYSGGDMLARVAYGLMLAHGMAWQRALLIGALVSSICAIPSIMLWIRTFRSRLKHHDQATTEAGSESRSTNKPSSPLSTKASDTLDTKTIVRALLGDRAFVVMTLSYSIMAVIREILFTWTTVFLVMAAGADSATATTLSLFLPFCMVASANTTGYVADHVQGPSRIRLLQFIPAVIVLASSIGLTVLLTLIGSTTPPTSIIVLLLILICYFGELHNTFIEGFQFVALSVHVNRPATVSGLIAFCSNFSSTASSAAVGAILGVSDASGGGDYQRLAWIQIYYVMSVCAAITAVASFVSLRLSERGAGAAAAAHVDDDDDKDGGGAAQESSSSDAPQILQQQ